MKSIQIIRAGSIENSLVGERRQYLAGDLAQPQKLAHLFDPDVEAGITCYKEYTIEKPHYHTRTTEYMYVVEGRSRYLDCTSKEEVEVRKGDFFLIRKNVIYAQKSAPGLKMIFFKYPSGNDKVTVEDMEGLEEWLASYDAPYCKEKPE